MAHTQPVAGVALSADGAVCASVAVDEDMSDGDSKVCAALLMWHVQLQLLSVKPHSAPATCDTP